MGEVIYLNKLKKDRSSRKEKEIPIDPEDIELYNFFTEVVDGFREFGFDVVDIIVIQSTNSNSKWK